MQKEKKITIYDIAKFCDVSIGTVSNAFNKPHTLSKKTRSSILSAAEKFNYQPSRAARELVSGRFKRIGFVMHTLLSTYVVNSYYIPFMKKSREAGYDSTISIVLDSQDGNGDGRIYGLNDYSGLIIYPYWDGVVSQIVLLKEQHYPFVLINSYLNDVQTDFIMEDQEEGAYIGTKFLLEKGEKRIGIITSQPDFIDTKLRLNGYKKALYDAGIAFNENYVVQSSSNTKTDKTRLYDTINKYKITTFYVTFSALLFDIYKALQQMSTQYARDVNIVTHDNIPDLKYIDKKITVITHDTTLLSETAFSVLSEKFKNPASNNFQQIKIPPMLIT